MKQHYILYSRYLLLPILIWGLILALQACKKDRVETPVPKSPEITHYYPNSGTEGALIHIEGKDLDADGLTVEINGKVLEILTRRADLLVVQAPIGGKTGNLRLKQGSKWIDVGLFTFQTLSLSQVWPQNGPSGSQIRLSGAGFGSATQPAEVFINDVKATIVSATDTAMVVIIPEAVGTGPVRIRVDGMESIGAIFTYQEITQIKPLTGGEGTQVRIYGPGLQTLDAQDMIDFNGKPAKLLATHPGHIVAEAPADVESGPVSITINGQRIKGADFTVVPPPLLYSVSPRSGPAGSIMTIKGVYFSRIAEENKIIVNGKTLIPTTATESEMQVVLPADLGRGEMTLSVNDQKIKGPVIALQNLGIKKVSPDNGLAGTEVVIEGTGFDPDKNNNKVYFNGVLTPVLEASDSQLKVLAPAGLSTGNLRVQVGTLEATAPTHFRRAGVKTIVDNLKAHTHPNWNFEDAYKIAVDSKGNIYLTNSFQHNIKKISPSGQVSHFSGDINGKPDYKEGSVAEARYDMSYGVRIQVDAQDNLWVIENNLITNGMIRKIDLNSGKMTTVFSGQKSQNIYVSPSGKIYQLTEDSKMLRLLEHPKTELVHNGMPYEANKNLRFAMDAQGAFYTDGGYSEAFIGRYPTDGPTSYHSEVFVGNRSEYGYLDGIGGAARLSGLSKSILNLGPNSLVFSDGAGLIRTIDIPSREVKTLVHVTELGYKDGDLRQARFGRMFVGILGDMAVGHDGSIYVVDMGNQAIRKIFLK